MILSDDLGQVLLVERGRPPAVGSWSVPGGLVERGESLRRACEREVAEETGLAVELGEVVKVLERVLRDARGEVEYHYIIVDFLGRVRSGELAPASDVRDARWVPCTDLGGLPTTQGLKSVVARSQEVARGEPPRTPLFDELLGP